MSYEVKEPEAELGEVKQNNKTLAFFEKGTKLVASVFAVVGSAITVYCSYTYINDCERYYNIPKKYFSLSSNDMTGRFMFMVLLFIIIGLPIIFSRTISKKRFDSAKIPMVVILSMMFLLLNEIFMINYFHIDNLTTFLLCTIVALCSTIVLIYLLPNNKEGSIIDGKVMPKSKAKLLSILIMLTLIISLVQFTVIGLLIYDQFSITVDSQTKYEVLTITAGDKTETQKLILSENDGKYLTVDFEYPDVDKNEIEFDSSSYKFYSIDDEYTVEYIKFDKVTSKE